MKVEIIDFKPEHFDQMDMRDYEAEFRGELLVLYEASIESKTAFVDGEIYSTWGIIKEAEGHYFWQVPSKLLSANTMIYARRAFFVIRKMIKNYENAYTFCRDDELHAKWMKFIGFKRGDLTFEDHGKSFVMYEAV